jgi:hypothetical protein
MRRLSQSGAPRFFAGYQRRATLMALSPLQLAVGSHARAEDVSEWIPPHAKFSPECVKALTMRGEPERFSKSRGELKYIGMPMGGDGRLWR